MAKHPLVKLRHHLEEGQLTSAMVLLGKKEVIKRLDFNRVEVRVLLESIFSYYASTENMRDPHFPRIMVRIMQRCKNVEWLKRFGDERFELGDHDTALQSYTAARLSAIHDEERQERATEVKKILLNRAKELCDAGTPLAGFSYIKQIDAFALIDEPELANTLIQTAKQYWKASINEVRTPMQYHTKGLTTVEEMLVAADRADILYNVCGSDLYAKVQEESEQCAQGELPIQQSWQHEYNRVLRRALEIQAGKDVLTNEQLETAGQYAMSVGNIQLAWTAFLKQGNTTALQELCCNIMRSGKPEETERICLILGQIEAKDVTITTEEELQKYLQRLLLLLPKDVRRSKSDRKSEERVRAEEWCEKVIALLTQISSSREQKE